MICYMHTLIHKFQTSFTVLILFTTAQERAQQQGHCPSGRFSSLPASPCQLLYKSVPQNETLVMLVVI